jgi:hypothetical protein
MLNVPHRLPIPGTGGSLIGMMPESTDKRSSHTVETFFLTGDPMNYGYQSRKKYFKSGRDSFTKKRDHRGYSFDYSHRNISFFIYENFCTDRYLLTRKLDIAHTGIPDNYHLGS